MQTNEVPHYDNSDNPTGCCARFNPEGWDGAELHFQDKRVLRATTRSAMHVPLNMGKVFNRVHQHIEGSGGYDMDDILVLSRDLSAWKAEHLFAVPRDIPDEEMTTISGDFITKVFEGPYKEAPAWEEKMKELVRARGQEPTDIYFFYTTCPKCAKTYGKNYVVGFARIVEA
ncbi:hydrolase [Aestuariivita boseongensis]|uniref:hydrolase n=1 Tax=Aestuariivita boseongensis TaxID=1470562 RepID=UPI000682BEB0|nr:hydrolase [Aestuariivita boseongensis]